MTLESKDKPQASKKFDKLKRFLIGGLGSEIRKKKIIAAVDRKTSKSGGKESTFVKQFLAPKLHQYFKQYAIDIHIEGISSEPLKSKFFGSRPAFDFSFSSRQTLFDSSPFPLDTVGEVKYDRLTFRAFITGLGQVIGYRQAANAEGKPKRYGYYIFFNTNLAKTLNEIEKDFLEELWERENIFVLIL